MSDAPQSIRQGAGDGSVWFARLREIGSVPGGFALRLTATLQVAGTYWRRARFWIFGGCYLYVALVSVPASRISNIEFPVGVALTLSVTLAAVVASLAALHLRRLLSGPAAHVMPAFVGPHLVVGALVSLLVWVAVPCAQAAITGRSVFHLVSLHALAGVLGALVLLFPPSILLVAAEPLAAVWTSASYRAGAMFLRSFWEGDEPLLGTVMVGLAIVSYPVTALVYLYTRNRAATFSDDLVVDRSHGATSRWKNWLLGLRDPAIEAQLTAGRQVAWATQRWRIPGVVSWRELTLLVAVVCGLMLAAWLAGADPAVPWLVATMASFVVLFIPLGSWRFRAMSLAGELMRPVTRAAFVRQYFASMLFDFFAWTVLATLLAGIGYISVIYEGFTKHTDPTGIIRMLFGHVELLLALATLLYGVALATLRFRYWLPWFAGIFLGSIFSIGYAHVAIGQWYQQTVGHLDMVYVVTALSLTFVATGCTLGGLAYRRWLKMDVG